MNEYLVCIGYYIGMSYIQFKEACGQLDRPSHFFDWVKYNYPEHYVGVLRVASTTVEE